MWSNVMSFVSFARVLFPRALACVALMACRNITEQPEGVTPSGKVIDPAAPKDLRLIPLIEAARVIDLSAKPNYKTCTEKTYLPDSTTKTFPENANYEFTSKYEYDNNGRRVKEGRYYGSETNSSVLTEWKYDSLGRIDSIVESIAGANPGEVTVSGNCKVNYDAESMRVIKYECFSGDGHDPEKLIRKSEVSYDLSLNSRVIIESSKEDGTIRVLRKTTEKHSDQEFRFALNTEILDYGYDGETQKVSSKTNTEVIFVNDKFNDILQKTERYMGDKISLYNSVCKLEEGLLVCSFEDRNTDGDVFETGKSKDFPVIVKRKQADLFETSGSLTLNLNELEFRPTELITVGVEGKKTSYNETPYSSYESITAYDTLLRRVSMSFYGIKDGKHSEQLYSYTYVNGLETYLSQKRQNDDIATSREGLGEFENQFKEVKDCSL